MNSIKCGDETLCKFKVINLLSSIVSKHRIPVYMHVFAGGCLKTPSSRTLYI